MTDSLLPQSRFWARVFVAIVVVMVAAQGWALFAFQREVRARRAFDDRRAYELCLSRNEGTADVNRRFAKLDKLLLSFGSLKDPKSIRFAAEEKASTLHLRDCEEFKPKP